MALLTKNPHISRLTPADSHRKRNAADKKKDIAAELL
jgi:hypothetical protein